MLPVVIVSALLMAAIVLMPSACGITLDAQTGGMQFTQEINIKANDLFTARMSLWQSSLYSEIGGTGGIIERHHIHTLRGDQVGSGIDIDDSLRYDYRYRYVLGHEMDLPVYLVGGTNESLKIIKKT